MKTPYQKKLLDPRWQKKRLRILERDDFTCQRCYDPENTLHVHHFLYIYGNEPWEIDDEFLITLCERCHSEEREYYSKRESFLLESLKKKRFLSSHVYQINALINLFPDNEDSFNLMDKIMLLQKTLKNKELMELVRDKINSRI